MTQIRKPKQRKTVKKHMAKKRRISATKSSKTHKKKGGESNKQNEISETSETSETTQIIDITHPRLQNKSNPRLIFQAIEYLRTLIFESGNNKSFIITIQRGFNTTEDVQIYNFTKHVFSASNKDDKNTTVIQEINPHKEEVDIDKDLEDEVINFVSNRNNNEKHLKDFIKRNPDFLQKYSVEEDINNFVIEHKPKRTIKKSSIEEFIKDYPYYIKKNFANVDEYHKVLQVKHSRNISFINNYTKYKSKDETTIKFNGEEKN